MSTATLDYPAADPAEDDHDAEFAACEVDPSYLIDRYGVIDNVQESGESDEGRELATVPFRLWPYQVPVLTDLMTQRQVVILKARQLGISWIVCGYVLWLCLFHAGKLVMLFSKGQREADELIRRITALYARLPDWLRGRLPAQTVNNTRELKWANGSRVQSMPATADAGVSFTASLIVLDEAARMKFGRQLYVAAKPTIDGGGQLIVLSTANGMGGFFHNLWNKAASGLSSLKPVFLPWWARPGRDQDWYDQVTRDAEDPATIPQEYPANPIEAFVASGRLRFPTAAVACQTANLRDPIPVNAWPASFLARRGWGKDSLLAIPPVQSVPNLRLYTPPVPGRSYVVSADVAEGKDPLGKRDSDFDAAVVLDCETWEEVASIHGRWEPDVWGLYLMAAAEAFNQAVVVVERNNHGHATLLELKHHHFPRDRVGMGEDGWPGWLTSPVSKVQGVALLAAALRDGLVTVRTQGALVEMHNYSVLKTGATGAPPGEHDDYVSAWVVGLSWLRLRAARTNAVAEPFTGGEPARMIGFLAGP